MIIMKTKRLDTMLQMVKGLAVAGAKYSIRFEGLSDVWVIKIIGSHEENGKSLDEDQDDFQWELDDMERREQEEIDSLAEEY